MDAVQMFLFSRQHSLHHNGTFSNPGCSFAFKISNGKAHNLGGSAFGGASWLLAAASLNVAVARWRRHNRLMTPSQRLTPDTVIVVYADHQDTFCRAGETSAMTDSV